MGKHFGKSIIAKVLNMKDQGMTNRAIAEEFGLTIEQLKQLIKRHNKAKRCPVVPKRQGRPRTRPITAEQDFLRRIKELEMQVQLYQSFLQAAGRR